MYQQATLFPDNKPQTILKNKDKDRFLNKKIGHLLVLEIVGKDKWNKKLYKCRCDCGEITVISPCNFYRQKGNLSCGCLTKKYRVDFGKNRKIDLTGQTFGFLTVIKESGERNAKGEILWECKCECGSVVLKNGVHLHNKLTTLHCGCQKKVKLTKKKIKKKPVDREQYAKDLYQMYIVDQGMSLRDTAIKEGYKRSVALTKMFMDFIPGYKEASEKRRAKSETNKYDRQRNKKSKLFRFEADFQNHCVDKINKKYGKNICECNDRITTGFEIDICTPWECYELKITSRHKDIFTAIGQLITNRDISGLKPILLIPSDIIIRNDTKEILKSNGIEIRTEKDLCK